MSGTAPPVSREQRERRARAGAAAQIEAEQGHGADCRKPTLRSGFRQQLMPDVWPLPCAMKQQSE